VLVARDRPRFETLAASLMASHGVQVQYIAVDLARDDHLDAIRRVTDSLDVGLLVAAACRSGAGAAWCCSARSPPLRGCPMRPMTRPPRPMCRARAGMRMGAAMDPEAIAQPILAALGRQATVLPGAGENHGHGDAGHGHPLMQSP